MYLFLVCTKFTPEAAAFLSHLQMLLVLPAFKIKYSKSKAEYFFLVSAKYTYSVKDARGYEYKIESRFDVSAGVMCQCAGARSPAVVLSDTEQKRQQHIRELIDTEEKFVKDLDVVIEVC